MLLDIYIYIYTFKKIVVPSLIMSYFCGRGEVIKTLEKFWSKIESSWRPIKSLFKSPLKRRVSTLNWEYEDLFSRVRRVWCWAELLGSELAMNGLCPHSIWVKIIFIESPTNPKSRKAQPIIFLISKTIGLYDLVGFGSIEILLILLHEGELYYR